MCVARFLFMEVLAPVKGHPQRSPFYFVIKMVFFSYSSQVFHGPRITVLNVEGGGKESKLFALKPSRTDIQRD